MLSPRAAEWASVMGAPQGGVYTAPMDSRQVELLPIAGVWALSALVLGWAYLADAWRRLFALLVSVAGLAFLIVAVNTEGLREAPTIGDFLFGTPFVLTQASASASLPYYLLTALCLLLGLAGLAVGERAAEALRRHPLAAAIALTGAVALLRFGFEKAAAPPALSRLFGVTWLAPVTGAFLFLNLNGAPRVWRRLVHALLVYAVATRGLVVALYVAASGLRLGSHYDIVPLDRIGPFLGGRTIEFERGGVAQVLGLILLPQLTFWVLYTLVVGLLGALAVWGLRGLHTPRAERRPGRLADARHAAALDEEDAHLAPPDRLQA